MSCLGARLADLLDGRLAPDAHEQVLVHVARCEPCREELVALRTVRSLLATTQGPPADSDLTDRLTAFVTTGPIPVVRDDAGSGAPARGRGRGVVAVAGGLTVAAIAVVWGVSAVPAPAGPAPAGPASTPVVPAVDRYTAEHLASTDGFPLTTPGSTVNQVAYGAPDPATALVPARSGQLQP